MRPSRGRRWSLAAEVQQKAEARCSSRRRRLGVFKRREFRWQQHLLRRRQVGGEYDDRPRECAEDEQDGQEHSQQLGRVGLSKVGRAAVVLRVRIITDVD